MQEIAGQESEERESAGSGTTGPDTTATGPDVRARDMPTREMAARDTAARDFAVREITSEAELDDLIGEPHPRDAHKVRHALDALDREWLAAAPFCLVATADGTGMCDVSPKGDPAGFVLVLDDRTLVIPDRPGNRRADGFRNVLANPHVGLIFLVPGRGDTLRVNGRARLLRDAGFFDRLTVRGHRPEVALLVEVEEVFSHCSKAFLRSALWKPDTWRPDAAPSRARMAAGQERRGQSVEELEVYYGAGYGTRLYG